MIVDYTSQGIVVGVPYLRCQNTSHQDQKEEKENEEGKQTSKKEGSELLSGLLGHQIHNRKEL